MDVTPIVALLLPPAVGGIAGYRADGDLNMRLRAGARAGVLMTGVSMLGIIIYGLYGLLFAIEDLYWPDLLGFIPIFGTVGTLFIGIYAISTATVGAVIGGYLVRDGV